MKKTLIALLSLTSLSSFAFHPEDKDVLSNIGVGTKLKIVQDINFKPNTKNIYLNDSQCYIDVKNVKNFDRVLKAGKTLLVVDTTTKYVSYLHGNTQTLKVNNLHINNITCRYMKNEKGELTEPTIGYFKDSVKDIIEIELANPVEI